MNAFDRAVNSGPRVSVMWLQRALQVTADGVIGPVTAALGWTADEVDDLFKAAALL